MKALSGPDKIPVKIDKMRANIINLNFIIFINNGLLINSFSDSAKLASDLSPLFKGKGKRKK